MSDVYTLATVANMEIAHRNFEARYIMAVSLYTDEEYSARPGDYFDRAMDTPLLDNEGNAMILVVRDCIWRDALTGIKVC